MEKIDSNSPLSRSADVVAENIERLKVLFPELITEGKEGASVNIDVLKALVGERTVTDADEKYGLNWHGKRQSRQLAMKPSTGTLRPCREESLDWDTTQNLMIEGENLEVLKLLQKSYISKVKMIYIDPPYNTGKDFVYPDDYRDTISNYLELTGQIEGEHKISTNPERSGRFHTDWLNMMYPRLMLAKHLLREDGVIFISIDDGELANLRKVCDEIFGEENFIVQIIWCKRSTPPNDKIIGTNHDYIVSVAKTIEKVGLQLRERSEEQIRRYQNPDSHKKGPWAPGDLMANVKGGRYVKSLHFPIVNPKTKQKHYPGKDGNWRFSSETIDRLLQNDEIFFGADGLGKPKLKRFLSEVKEGITYPSVWNFVPLNTNGSMEMVELFDNANIFENPKPVGLIQELIKLGTERDGWVMDFFAGSGTTGHAVMAQNAADGGKRRYILVQLPEPLDPSSKTQKAAADFCDELGKPRTIAELTKERLRRAAAKIKAEKPEWQGDAGFRVFKLDTSNVRAWDPDRDNFEKSLSEYVEHLMPGRTQDDLLYEVLLKLGLDLCTPIEEMRVQSTKSPDMTHTIHVVSGGRLIACLSEEILAGDWELLGKAILDCFDGETPHKDSRVLFRDSAFADDITKINLTAFLEQGNIMKVESI